ncbi:carbon-nitrogen hydrolase family protein [Arthrobacter sp. NPDC056886]|uniref:carbon-nitrogen hydrolase family protein n=1 Tax=Arthrobacter sp. NPDC056886 TaxID=3345960 RepID=UPI00366E8EC3
MVEDRKALTTRSELINLYLIYSLSERNIMSRQPLALAMVQSPAESLESFAEGLKQRVKANPNVALFVYPELHLCSLGAADADSYAEFTEAMAEPLDGPRGQVLAQLAGDLGIWLVPGSVHERADDGTVYNTAVAYSPEGKLVASYRKIFPRRPVETVASGTEFVVFDMPGYGRVGLSICYDSWFPEHARHLAWKGAELILNVVATDTADRTSEITIARANAIVNQVFFASVNGAGPWSHGRSLLADPSGRVRIDSNSNEAIVLTEVIDLDEVSNTRRFGTASVSRPWDFFAETEESIDLPLYSGNMSASRWGETASRLSSLEV